MEQVQNEKIVTFGIKPTKPETGYGYIELSESNADQFSTSNVENFVEKPDLISAKKCSNPINFYGILVSSYLKQVILFRLSRFMHKDFRVSFKSC